MVRLFQRYAQVDVDHSLDIPHDDPTPRHVLHVTSTQSTPITSPSTGNSSLFPSLSSTTSESTPSPEQRSEFGLWTPRSSAYSPVLGSASSRSSQPISPWSRSTTASETHISAPRNPPGNPSRYPSQRPSTAPHSPCIHPMAINPADTSAEHHMRSHSRLAASIKSFLSKPALASPSRFSFNSSISPSEASSPPTKWPRNSRPPNLDISASLAAAPIPSPSRGSNPLIDAHRRYASEAVAKISDSKFGNASQDCFNPSSQNVSPVVPRERDPKTRNVLRRRPSGSAKQFKGRDRGMSTPSYPHEHDADHPRPLPKDVPLHPPLTPAGAVVEAYKQQELSRDDKPNPPKLSIDDAMRPATSHCTGHDRDSVHSPTPRYASFGLSSEHRPRAADSGDRWDRLGADQPSRGTSRVTLSHQPSASDPSSRSLTRKVSTKWRKTKGGGITLEDSLARDRDHPKARPSFQETWRSDKSTIRSTGRSMDGVLGGGVTCSSPTEGFAREKAGTEGGKLWRLMRRISTGGLRDKFLTEKVVPPVPAIPKELLGKSERIDEPVSTPRHHPSPTLRDKDRTSTAPENITSVAITSSSSNSSDVASIHFFHKTHSSRSSVSSYGDAVGLHSKEISLDRHIIAPLEQLRLGEDHGAVPRSPRRSASLPAGMKKAEDAEEELVALPSPRRQTCCRDSPSPAYSRPPSASMSSPGSARASRQSGLVVRQSKTADGLVSLSPPPRPARSSRRGESATSSPSHSLLVKQTDSSFGVGVGVARQLDRTLSAQSDTTARPGSPEPRRSRDEDASHTRTQFTYRELNAPRRPPLSEQEKVDVWNDLLERSDKAGGTLHINTAAELLSDHMRFSMLSEI